MYRNMIREDIDTSPKPRFRVAALSARCNRLARQHMRNGPAPANTKFKRRTTPSERVPRPRPPAVPTTATTATAQRETVAISYTTAATTNTTTTNSDTN